MKTGRQDPALQEIQVQATDRHETAQLKPPSKVHTMCMAIPLLSPLA